MSLDFWRDCHGPLRPGYHGDMSRPSQICTQMYLWPILLNIVFHAPMGRIQFPNTKSCLLQISAQWCHRRTKRLKVQTSPFISDLNTKMNSPDQAKKEISKPNNWNNQWFKLQLSTTQARRQKKNYPTRLQDLLRMSRQRRKAYSKEIHNYLMGRLWKKRL